MEHVNNDYGKACLHVHRCTHTHFYSPDSLRCLYDDTVIVLMLLRSEDIVAAKLRLPTHRASSLSLSFPTIVEKDDQFQPTVPADAILYTGRQEDYRHCEAEASGVILLKFRRCLHCSAGGRCAFAERPTHGVALIFYSFVVFLQDQVMFEYHYYLKKYRLNC